MREYMMRADVGDEQRGEDPTTNALVEKVAELLGKEAAVYLPSGTLCNEIAYRVHCEAGDEIILDKTSHALHFETGGPAALSGVMTRPLDGERGIFSSEQVRGAIRPGDRHSPRSRLLSVENTANLGGGTIWPLECIQNVVAVAREQGLKAHLDGARLLNAVVASSISPKDYAAPFDSVWIDLSKGLGAPIGAVLAGTAPFIERAWRFKHQFGGAMRQSGIIAAAGIYALDHHLDRLADDHANARRLAQDLAQIPGIEIDPASVQTNMVYFNVDKTGVSASEVAAGLLDHGVRIGPVDEATMRAVTHLDVDAEGIAAAGSALREVLAA
jgi:threonine aldolase